MKCAAKFHKRTGRTVELRLKAQTFEDERVLHALELATLKGFHIQVFNEKNQVFAFQMGGAR